MEKEAFEMEAVEKEKKLKENKLLVSMRLAAKNHVLGELTKDNQSLKSKLALLE